MNTNLENSVRDINLDINKWLIIFLWQSFQ